MERVKRSFLIVHIVIGAACATITLGLGYFGVHGIVAPLPEPATSTFLIPKDAMVLPHKEVQPGTFRINTNLNALLARARTGEHPEQPLVCYDNGRLSTTPVGDRVLVVDYWLPRRGWGFYDAMHTSGFGPELGW